MKNDDLNAMGLSAMTEAESARIQGGLGWNISKKYHDYLTAGIHVLFVVPFTGFFKGFSRGMGDGVKG